MSQKEKLKQNRLAGKIKKKKRNLRFRRLGDDPSPHVTPGLAAPPSDLFEYTAPWREQSILYMVYGESVVSAVHLAYTAAAGGGLSPRGFSPAVRAHPHDRRCVPHSTLTNLVHRFIPLAAFSLSVAIVAPFTAV